EAHLHFNNDRHTTYPAADLIPIAQARAMHLAELLSTEGQPADPCGFCARCKINAEENRDVQLVWGVRRNSRLALRSAGSSTIEELAQGQAPDSIDRFTWSRLHTRATLQLAGENSETPSFVVHNPATLAAMPDPSPGDIFFDFEGDPL